MQSKERLACAAAAAVTLALAAAPAEGQLLGRIRDRVRDRVREKVEQGVDRAVDGVAGAVEGGVKGSAGAAPASAPAAPSPAAAPVSPSAPPAAAPRPTAVAAPAAVASTAAPAGGDTARIRPARLAALTTPLEDADLAWLVPLLRAQGADMARERTQTGAAASAGAGVFRPDAGEARVARIRSGQVNALDELRAFSPHAVVPASARYHAACSAGLSEGAGGTTVFAVFTGATEEEARALYRPAGFEWTGYTGPGFRAVSPDRRITVSIKRPADNDPARGFGKRARAGEIPGYDHLVPCADLTGTVLYVSADGAMEMRERMGAAGAAAVQGSAERLPDALRRAGLTPQQWDAVVGMLWEAATDDMFASNAAALDQVAGSRAAGDRRRANVRWYLRNRAAVDAAMPAPGGR